MPLLPRAGDGVHRSGSQIHPADGMVLGVGHVQRIAHQFHALGVVERGGGIVAVHEGFRSRTDDGLRLSLQVGDDDAVVVGVRNEQSVARAVGKYLTRESQRGFFNGLRFEAQVAPVDQPLFVKLGDHSPYQIIKSLVGQFTLVLADHLAFRVNEHQRRPGTAGVLPPHLELGVIDDGVLQLVALGRQQHVVGVLLVGELGRVDAYHHQLVRVLFFHFPQLRKHMHAVDSTVGPEVENDHLAAQVGHAQWPVGVDPFDAIGEVRRVHGAGERLGGH